MRLKTLEIKGFKSFANETAIHFSENVIGIVGPNGSGKSNIVDAIRWVLGEQKSAELRLDKMNSVIFNGTKKRKPAQVAQVTLTFENTKNILPVEYQNVAITRMLYASGDSEYRLNGVSCRLKDITMLFADTGIGSNSYAIIALGMVDEILNDKQNSRRMMLEQAAGVGKYKSRKNETMTKLNAATEDLNRVEDLLFEIDGNLKTLEKQAKRTQKFVDLKAEYKTLAIDLALLKWSVFKTDYKNIEKQIGNETDKYNGLDATILNTEAKIEACKKENLEKEQLLSERQRDLNQVMMAIRQAEQDKKMAVQQQVFTEQNVKKFKEQIDAAKTRLTQLNEDILFYQSEIHVEKRLESKLEDQLEAAKDNLEKMGQNHGSLKADLDVLLKKQQVVEKEVVEIEKFKAIQTNQIENLQKTLQRNEQETAGRKAELSVLDGKIIDIDKVIAERAEQLRVFTQKEEERLAGLEHADKKMMELSQLIIDAARELDAKRNEYKLTKSMVDNLEGYPESIRFLTKSRDWKAPLLTDLVFVKEEYRTAIESFLEPYLNHYVVQNVSEAAAAIRVLTTAQKGKARFFMADAFEKLDLEPIQLPEMEGVSIAIDCIEPDMRYKNIFNYLLHNVLIIDKEDIEDTSIPNEEFLKSYVWIGKRGNFIKQPFSVAGGSVGLFEGKKIGRKKNLEILEKTVKHLEHKTFKLGEEIQYLKSQIHILRNNDKRAEIKKINDALNLLNQERVSLTTRLENYTTFLRETDAKQRQIETDIHVLQQKNVDSDAQLAVKKANAVALKMQMGDMDGSFRSISEQMSNLSQAYNDKNVAFIRQQNKVTTQQRELSFREKQHAETKTGMTTAQQQMTDSEIELGRIRDAIQQLENDLKTNYGKKREKEGTLSEVEQTYYKMRNEIQKEEDEVRKWSRQRNDVQISVNRLKDKFTELRLQISAIGERLQVEFNVLIDDLIAQTPKTNLESVSKEDLQKKTDAVKKQIDHFGEVNPMALEAYSEMKSRRDTIAAQRDDILQAKESLMKTIQEIETVATTQFMNAFNAIRASFIEVFKNLFHEEDTADLILTDPAHPLESGVQIMAKPKGKRPQSIAQLSGGEKTLTATALLFAMYLYKPAPFCIFDEVDAPLDDANIEKFNKIIRKFSENSQFIVVTHNKATMDAVDIIYGVHMPEQGVSEVTPVDFRTFKNEQTLEVLN